MNNNPFTPNFGQIPLHMAGRGEIISELLQTFEGTSRDPGRTSILIGARGTGKTALLSYFSNACKSRGWISVDVTCIGGMLEDILQQAVPAAKEYVSKREKTRLTGLSIGQIFSISWEPDSRPGANWRTRMTKILDALEEHDIGLLITVDEVTPQLSEMIELASTHQLFMRENRKIALFMAGLPSEVSAMLNDRTVSFLRRATQYTLTRLEDYEVEEAFLRTVEDAGKTISKEALERTVAAIAGFPYMMQLAGYRIWQQAAEKKEIGLETAEKGIVAAGKDFENRVLKATLRALSPGDLRFLEAMVPDSGASSVADLEKRLKKSSGYISRYRARLLESGVIESPARGQVAFALPGLRECLRKGLQL